ncbi:hypothetical protein LCL87_17065 [Rhodococcus hoagii]|nr:hypothetical protein [Prescottella equi]
MYSPDAREAQSLAMKKWREDQVAQREAELIRIHAEREESERVAAENREVMMAVRAEVVRKRTEGAFEGVVGEARRRIQTENELVRETGRSSVQSAAFKAQSEHAQRMNEEHAERQKQFQQWQAEQAEERSEELREIAEKNAAKQASNDEFEAARARVRAKRGW